MVRCCHAHAQLAVYDAASYAKLIQQATTAVSQLNELKALSKYISSLPGRIARFSGVL